MRKLKKMEKNLPADSGVDIRIKSGASFGPHQGAGGSDVLGDQAAGTVHQRGEHAVEKPCYCHRHSWEADR